MKQIVGYQNGNTYIELFDDGTRTIQFDDNIKLDYPLNIDIRVQTKCSFGYDPVNDKTFCGFCHESARVDGVECDYTELSRVLEGLPRGIELAIGSNELTDNLYQFLITCKLNGFICNLTVNQGHLKRDLDKLNQVIGLGLIKGLGVSYRDSLKWNVPQEILDYPNTVFHTIVGIDNFQSVLDLKEKGVRKILVLGEKDFGYNKGKVDVNNQSHKQWFWWILKMFDKFDVVSFDNLALQQLSMRRNLTTDGWDSFYQGEHSFYINAVDGYFSPSSRNSDKTEWKKTTVKEYFKSLQK